MLKNLLFLILLWLCYITAKAQTLPADIDSIIKQSVITVAPNKIIKKTRVQNKRENVSHVMTTPTDLPIVINICDDDLDGFSSINIDSINNVILLQNGNTPFTEGVLISTLNGKIIKVNDLVNTPYLTDICTSVAPPTSMTDIAINQAGNIFVCSGSNIVEVDPATCISHVVISNNMVGPINSLSFDRHDNLYFGGGSTKVARCDAGTFTPVYWHDFLSGQAGGDFVILNDKMYISWVLGGSFRLFEVTVDANINYVSHVDLGPLPASTYGLASEYGKLYGVTPSELFKINISGGGFTTQPILHNPGSDFWGGSAGLHEAAAFDVKAFETLADAQTLQNPLPGHWTNTIAGGQTIYVAIINIITGATQIVPVLINVNVTPVNAGPDQLTCNTTVTMSGNTPASGTGLWVLQSGFGVITDPANPSTTITGLLPGDNIFKWTINNNTCIASDLVTIHIDPLAVPSFASLPDICSGSVVPVLPNTSINGITGTWGPAIVSNTVTGTYTFTPNPGECGATAQLTQVIIPKATPNFNSLPDICSGSLAPTLPTVSINAISGTWSPVVVSNTTTGTYTFTPNAGECAIPIQLTQVIIPKATPGFSSLPAICSGSLVPILPNISTNGISGTWSPATVSNTASGTYTFTPNAGECAVTAQLTQIVNQKITPSFGALPDICSGTSAPVLPSTSVNGITGTWNPAVINNMATGIYTFTPNAGECAISSQLTQKVNSSIASFAPLAPICIGDAAPLLSNISVEGITGVWLPPTVNNMVTASYTFVPAPGGCAVTPFKLIQEVKSKPVAFAGNDGLAAIGIPYQLQASGGISYQWINGASLLNNPNIANPKAILTNPTMFSVKVTGSNGCTATDDVFIKLYNGTTYYIPNAFTPNADGKNDVFKAVPAGISSTRYFNIYNRWGQLVFSTSDLSIGWDGNFKAVKQPSDAYIWMIKGTSTAGELIEMKGTVQLIR